MLPLTRLLASAETLLRFLVFLQSDFSSLGAVRYPGFISVGVACRALEPCGILEERANHWRSARGVHLPHYRPTGRGSPGQSYIYLDLAKTTRLGTGARPSAIIELERSMRIVDSAWRPLSPDRCLTGLYVSNSANLVEYKRRRREDIRARTHAQSLNAVPSAARHSHIVERIQIS